MAVVVLLLNEKEQEHKLEHGMQSIVDINELKPKLKINWNQNCKYGEYLPCYVSVNQLD